MFVIVHMINWYMLQLRIPPQLARNTPNCLNCCSSVVFSIITRIVCIRPKGRTQCIFPRSQHSCLYVYIYIDTKFSYDNNVYFSIYCEHRQLKHGMHVLDPSREVSSHCMTVQVGTRGYKWFYVVKSGFMWLKVVLCG